MSAFAAVDGGRSEGDLPGSRQLLYVDILNYSTEFFLLNDWHCGRALSRMSAFVSAANASGIKLKAFLDEGTKSTEASFKWRSRREKEVKKGEKNVPQGSTVLLGDILRKCGVEVCYSCEMDNDDTLAFHAEADGAAVLSHDKDMFRYTGFTYTVYSDYQIANGRLYLTKHPIYSKPPHRSSTPRPLGPPPAVQPAVRHMHSGVYLRGSPSPLVKAMGYNPHGVVAPLRHAMYHVTGVTGVVQEEWPEWDALGQTVRWATSEAVPNCDPELIRLLEEPDEAVRRFFPVEAAQPHTAPLGSGISKSDWKKHVMCVRSVVYELCVMARPGGPSLLDLMLRYEAAMSGAADGSKDPSQQQPRWNRCGTGGRPQPGRGNPGGRGGSFSGAPPKSLSPHALPFKPQGGRGGNKGGRAGGKPATAQEQEGADAVADALLGMKLS